MQACIAVAGTMGALPSLAAATQRQRRASVSVQAQQKGFSGGQGQKLPKQVKKSKRGKVASRPSPKRTLEQLQADQEAYEAALRERQQPSSAAAPASAAGSDDEDEYVLPRISSSSASSSSSGRGGGSREVTYGSTEAVPEVVTDRMLKRVIIFMGTPVFVGILLFPLFYYLKVKQEIDLPNWVAYLTSSITFGGGLLGISYGILSASWDPRREGSMLGWTEFQANVPLLLDRFKRK